jgi:hypothetical protein
MEPEYPIETSDFNDEEHFFYSRINEGERLHIELTEQGKLIISEGPA